MNWTIQFKPSFYVAAIITACLFTQAQASEDAVEFEWNFKTIKMVESANKDNGQKLAKAHRCSKCHGDSGISDEDDTPSIAGQTPSYFYKQMLDYRTKDRSEKQMHKAAKKLNPQQMADMAAWYANQKAEPSLSGGKEPPTLVTKGDKKRLLLPCNACHGKDGNGYGYESPALTGQRYTHFIDTMTEFKEGDRENDHYGRMRFIASQLTDEEIETLAKYYSAKPLEEE